MAKNCSWVSSPEALDAYFAGGLDEGERRTLEEHVFDCDACGARFGRTGDLVARLRELGPALLFVVDQAQVQRYAARGLCIQKFELGPGENRVETDPDAHVVLFHKNKDFGEARHIDLEFYTEDSTLISSERNIPAANRTTLTVACTPPHLPSKEFPLLRVECVLRASGKKGEVLERFIIDASFGPRAE